jgi:hypothetical protein
MEDVIGMAEKKAGDSDYLTAQEILDMDDREVVDVRIKQWKNKLLTLRALDGNTAMRFQDLVSDPEQRKAAWIDIVALSAVRNVGTRERPAYEPMFTREQAMELRNKSAAAMIGLQKHISALNGFNEAALEAAKND